MPAKKTPATPAVETAAPKKRDRSTKQVVKVYVTVKGVGRVYKESSGRYVAQARRVAGGPRTRRRFATLAEAKAGFESMAAEHAESVATTKSLDEIDVAAKKVAKSKSAKSAK